MHKKFKKLGFTMAEMLIVIGIIVVLTGVGFIAVQRYQRSLTQLDRDAMAKELFVAAQNHLSMAKSEDYQGLSETNFGIQGKGTVTADADNDDVYYIDSENKPAVFNQILPFGSIDSTILANHYIIRYQPKAAIVLDVFYWTINDPNQRYNCDDINASSISDLVGSDRGDKHANYSGSGVLGWFGGEKMVKSGESLTAPSIEVINKEKLFVNVKNTNTTTSVEDVHLKLIITGMSSKAKAAIEIDGASPSPRVSSDGNGGFTVVLDDITSNMHFAQINGSSDFQHLKDDSNRDIKFIPGENISVQAVSYSNSELTSVVYSGEWITNSLFEEISQKTLDGLYADLTNDVSNIETPSATDPWITAKIGNIRHLENLDADISHFGENNTTSIQPNLSIINAIQVSELDWNDFKEKLGDAVTIYDASLTPRTAKSNCFVPVTPSTTQNGTDITPIALTYQGLGVQAIESEGTTTYEYFNHTVKNITVDNSSGDIEIIAGGLFGQLTSSSSVSNLELIDFSITTSSGNAGALVGTLEQTSALADDKFNVSNVLAHNSTAATDINVSATGNTEATIGHAGGLIGEMTGEYGKVEKSAAALIVSSTGGNAGGLIGKAAAETVSACYSGGHTIDDTKGTGAVVYSDTAFNVTGTTSVGGLIGDAGATGITNSYSTCSATGATVGGLIGQGSGTVSGCYCTGLVAKTESGTLEGAFAGSVNDITQLNGCYFFEIINERESTDTSGNKIGGYDYLPCIGNKTVTDANVANIVALDADADSYNSFTSVWSNAEPYNKTTLTKYYGVGSGDARVPQYNLKTVAELGATVSADTDFVATHYGDWPAPEIFVLNTANTTN